LISFQNLSAKEDTSCRYRNLMEDNWNKLRNMVRTTARWIDMPAYSQGRTGTCYAFAATQLVDYWRQTRGTRIDEEIMLASPIHMAMAYKTAVGERSEVDAGLIYDNIKALKRYGVCPQEVANKDIRAFLKEKVGVLELDFRRRGGKVEDDTVFAELTQGFIVQQTGAHGGDGNFNVLDPKTVTFGDYYKWARSRRRRQSIRDLPKRTLKKVYDAFMVYMRRGDYIGFLEKVLKNCEKRKHHIKFLDTMPAVKRFDMGTYKRARRVHGIRNNKQYWRWRTNGYKDMIRTLLNRKNAPAVGIAYCSAMLDNPRERRVMTRNGTGGQGCGGHASIIVGKKEKNGKCMYLLKNTWNSDDICRKQDEGCLYRKVKDPKTGTEYTEEVGTWVYEDDLVHNLWFISYIYPNKRSEKKIEAYWKRVEEKYIQAGEVFQDLLDDVRDKKKRNRWRRR